MFLLDETMHRIFTILAGAGISIFILRLIFRFFSRPKGSQSISPVSDHVCQLAGQLTDILGSERATIEALAKLDGHLCNLPQMVLRTIQGDVNHLKGTVAEHISYLQLNSVYDRLLPFNSIVDFIGIKFPRDGEPGRLDFIDIKSDKARLSQEQSKLRKIIDNKQIHFVVVKVTTDHLPLDSGEPAPAVEDNLCE
jgi:hypothetical protein